MEDEIPATPTSAGVGSVGVATRGGGRGTSSRPHMALTTNRRKRSCEDTEAHGNVITDSGSTQSYVTPYIAKKFRIEPEKLCEPFEVSTSVGESVIARCIYRGCPVKVHYRLTITDLVELEMHGKVIAYASRQLKAHEKNYPTHHLELAAMIRWLKLLKYYDVHILYHPGKANVVADALSRRSMGSLAHVEADKRTMMKEVYRLASLGVQLLESEDGGVVLQNRAESSLVAEVKEKQFSDPYLLQLKEGIHKHKTMAFEQGGDDGTLRYRGRLCVPDVDGLRERIMSEAHNSRYSIHPDSIKMYHDLKEVYWWNDMKKNIIDFVPKCPNCQQKGLSTRVNLSTAFHPQIDGQAECTIQTLEDMLRACVIEFKDIRHRDLEFQVDDWVFLKVSPMKGVMRFGKKGKLSPRYIGPYRILRRIRQVAYELELPQELATVHLVFHVSMLKKLMGDPSLVVPTEIIGVKDSMSYEEIPVAILDRQIRKLRTKEIASVKVLWRNQMIEEATWEAEEDMKSRYPHLFEEQKENVEGPDRQVDAALPPQ
ncbi:uncharacterized protein [Nicotiana sylvestris]|uniref:uncharacterized protein n=1 Tax=Nicotiana sylvestris TaxID=4096 RepID=UPI00388C7528